MNYRIILEGSFYPVVLAVIKAASPEEAIKRFRNISGSTDKVIATSK